MPVMLASIRGLWTHSLLFDFVVVLKRTKVKSLIQTLKTTDVDVEPLCL